MLLRLLDKLDVREIAIAGFDGYSADKVNYASEKLDLKSTKDNPVALNVEIQEMVDDYINTRIHQTTPISFITESRFDRSSE